MGRLLLTGVQGYVEGESAEVESGGELLLGRSRNCGFSLRKTAKWMRAGLAEEQGEKEFRSISRTHTRVKVVSPGQVEVEGLGANGTFIDGVRIDRILLTDLGSRAHEMRLGKRETFRMEWLEDGC